VGKAIVVAKEMAKHGHRLHAVRLDSGDLLELSRLTRRLLDDAGCHDVQIFASGGLDEFQIAALLDGGAPIDGFGVGTLVGCSADAPWTDCAYKMVEYEGRPVLKLSTGKQTLPGAKQVFRFRGADGSYTHDTIACAGEPTPLGVEELLEPVMVAGRRLRPDPPLADLRRRFAADFADLPPPHKRLLAPPLYEVRISGQLERLQDETVTEIRRREVLP
jgi:nicotinate phosphoribosyltransferase